MKIWTIQTFKTRQWRYGIVLSSKVKTMDKKKVGVKMGTASLFKPRLLQRHSKVESRATRKVGSRELRMKMAPMLKTRLWGFGVKH